MKESAMGLGVLSWSLLSRFFTMESQIQNSLYQFMMKSQVHERKRVSSTNVVGETIVVCKRRKRNHYFTEHTKVNYFTQYTKVNSEYIKEMLSLNRKEGWKERKEEKIKCNENKTLRL